MFAGSSLEAITLTYKYQHFSAALDSNSSGSTKGLFTCGRKVACAMPSEYGHRTGRHAPCSI